jgi:hypothetical protein
MMRRSEVSCLQGHTALFPDKDDVRAEWAHKVARDKHIATVSHGALSVLNVLRHTGLILVMDKDPGVIDSTIHMMGEGQGARFPKLNLLPVLGYASDVMSAYVLKYGVKDLGAVDLDFTGTVKEAWDNAKAVVTLLTTHNYKGLVLLTFRDGRDQFGRNATAKRIKWLRSQLPQGIKKVTYRKYRSDWIGRKATREDGSSMCIVEIQF